jgi:hypothetical protein
LGWLRGFSRAPTFSEGATSKASKCGGTKAGKPDEKTLEGHEFSADFA